MATGILRAVIGLLFVGHGLQKLKGWFGGYGLEGTGQFFESIGLRPGKRHALAAGITETGGGALLALGLLTPFAAAGLTGTMVTAVKTVHLPNGPWVANGGWEYNAVLAAALFAIAESGPGPLSLDHALGTKLSGPFVALAQLAAGAGGAYVILSSIEEAQEQQTVASAPADVH